jgi:hypothetical protein
MTFQRDRAMRRDPRTDHSGHCDGTEAGQPALPQEQEGRRRGWPAQDTGALMPVPEQSHARDGRRGKDTYARADDGVIRKLLIGSRRYMSIYKEGAGGARRPK